MSQRVDHYRRSFECLLARVSHLLITCTLKLIKEPFVTHFELVELDIQILF